MGLTPKNDLAIVEIVYYTPALFLAAYVTRKHGFGRQLGWMFLIVLSVLRIVGSATGIAATDDPTTTLIEISVIFSSVGLTPLLLAMMGLLKRVNEGMGDRAVLKARFFSLMQMPAVVGLGLAIIGGTKAFDSKPSTQNEGHTYQKAAILIFLAVLIVLIGIAALTLAKIRHVIDGEKRLLFASIASAPFLCVRIVYSLIAVFNPHSSIFGLQAQSTTATVVQAIMAILMEFIVVAIYLAAGLTVAVIPRAQVQPGYQQAHSRGDSPQQLQAVPKPTDYNTAYQGGQQQGVAYEPNRNAAV